ncbi:stage III sporulation protein AA [Sporolactobacillus sp. THM7-7]|nr:stage III sporulation protein AA [Sporolactobacillus sp. THM7-7]
MSRADKTRLEEIRCRARQPLEFIVSGKVWRMQEKRMPIFHPGDAKEMLQKISRYSFYTLEEELRRGYITIPGGHRIGLAGRVITENGRVLRLREVTFFNIRIAREKIGAARPLVPHLYKKGHWLSALIIGAPQTGKTTLIRDLARLIGEGIPERSVPAQKAGIVDERSEIAGCIGGVPQNRLGKRTDVLDACPKAEGMMMMIRSMSPDVLIVDEIGREEDTEALLESLNAGIAVVATAHAHSIEEISRRPTIRPLIEARLFKRYIALSRVSRSGSPGYRLHVCDEQGRPMTTAEEIWS